MVENLLLWVFKIRLLYMSVHSDEHPLLRCSRKILYVWDDFRIIFLNYLFMLMTRSYNGTLIQTNSAINILIDLIWILSYFLLCRCARVYILHIFNNKLFIDLSGMCVPLLYLPLLNDFNFIPPYSWGLASFYICICNCVK